MPDEMTVRPPRISRAQARVMEIARLVQATQDKDWRIECIALASIAATVAMSANGLPVDETTFESITEMVETDLFPLLDRHLAEFMQKAR
jgi:hypothetical protein